VQKSRKSCSKLVTAQVSKLSIFLSIPTGLVLAHYAVIAEFDVQSYRTAAAQDKVIAERKPAASRRQAKN
jgi:hypothetical protein